MAGSTPVADNRPPERLVRAANVVLRAVLNSPLRKLVRPSLAVLEFKGRKSGRAYRIPVGWHVVDGSRVVFTPAGWRVNFRDGGPVTVAHRGGRASGTGTLVEDPAVVADGLQQALDGGSTPSLLGLKVEKGHRVTAEDAVASGRSMIRLELDGSRSS
jgi:hypothetical protein